MPLYESTLIARHEMSTQQVEGLAASFTAIIEENGGKVHKTEHWGLRNLAYRIKKNRKGHFVFFNIDAASEAVQEYERNLRLNEDILRYMTVRVEELDPEPSPMMQTRSPRDDRSRRGGPYAGRPRSQPAESAPAAGSARVEAEADGKKAAATDPAPAAKEKLPAAEAESGGTVEEVKSAPKAKAKAATSDSDEAAAAEPEKKPKAKTAAKKKTDTAEAEPEKKTAAKKKTDTAEAEPEKKTKSQAAAKEKTEAKTKTAVKDKATPKTAKAKTTKAKADTVETDKAKAPAKTKAKGTKKSKSDPGDET